MNASTLELGNREAYENLGIILPPSPLKKKRGRISTNRRKEVEEKEMQAQKKNKNKQHLKLTKKGVVKVKCSVCSQLIRGTMVS